MPSLVCHHLSFAWPSGEYVFEDLNVSFPDGLTGFVGRNGAGKSTLLRLLTGELAPAAGSVSGADLIGYLPQQLVLEGPRTVADVLGIDAIRVALNRIVGGTGMPMDFETVGEDWDIEERSAAALADFGFTDLALDRTIGSMSGGEVILLALAGLFLARPDVLILDEPTNNLDRSARQRLYAAIAHWRGPVIVVSHDRELLALADHIGELRDGTIHFYGGSFEAYEQAVATEQEAAQRALRAAESDLRRQRRELAEMRTKLDRRQRYGKSQESGMPKGAINQMRHNAELSSAKLRATHTGDVDEARQQVEAAEERVRDDDVIRIDLSATSIPASRDVLILDDVVLRNGAAVSLHIRGPERIGLTGPNGSGKTTMIDTLIGRVAPRSGAVDLRVPYAYLPQRLQLLADEQTVLSAVAQRAPSADANALRSQLARFLLDADTIERPVGTLSGGERFRASLAMLLLGEPPAQLLILDEPTNNLDLASVGQLTSALQAFRGALLVASHDEAFLNEVEIGSRVVLGRPEIA